MGHSFGGYIATKYAKIYPENIQGLILLSPLGIPKLTEKIKKPFWKSLVWDMNVNPVNLIRT